MAQPIWQTPTGNLGTVPEEVFYSVVLRAIDPSNPENPIKFQVISGELPGGIQLAANGTLEGVPVGTAIVQGVPFPIDRDITSKFSVRASTEKIINGQRTVDRFVDQTFTLTVAGQNVPVFVTQPGLIATFSDAGPAQVTIEFFDGDEDDDVVVSIAVGNLPPGLTINNLGVISGIIPPIATSTLYNFSVGISDGKSSNLRSFSIQVNRDDNTRPFLLNAEPSNLGTYRSDNFFAVNFDGFNFSQQPFEYLLLLDSPGTQLPPGTQLDSETGWLYGVIPDLGLTTIVYNFQIQLKNITDPSLVSPIYNFSIRIIGFIDTEIVWLSPENLGTINNGEVSTFTVAAKNFANRSLQYRLAPGQYPISNIGVYNKLPQGLILLPSGDISGRTSFNTFSLDNGKTTFDKNSKTRTILNETTFDLTFQFVVNAYSSDGLINVFKEFKILVNRKYNEPFENLYLRAMPPINDRDTINSLLQNSDVFPPNLMYRNDDLYFGVAKSIVYEHAFGLTPSTIEQYVDALDKNHYWKDLTIGEIQIAQARDPNENVMYEVVYARIIGGLLNDQGQSVSKEVTWPYPISINDDPVPITTVYPNSLINMRGQIIDQIGQVGTILPRWMTSKQKDGRVLGFTPAWVIAYVKPEFGDQIAYNVKTRFGQNLNKIDFNVDRYSLDRSMSKNWDSVTKRWVPTGAETTFDLLNHYRLLNNEIADGGEQYRAGDRILISGNTVGGVAPDNNIVLTVGETNDDGKITNVFFQGIAPLLSAGQTFIAVQGINIESGSGATFDVKRVNLEYFVNASGSGAGYSVGDQLTLLGSLLGGIDSVNDCLLTITNVGVGGNVLAFSIQGTPVPGVALYTTVSANKVYGNGAQFDFISLSGEKTLFDTSSLRFIAPVDKYSTSNEFDKYLVFPKRTILT